MTLLPRGIRALRRRGRRPVDPRARSSNRNYLVERISELSQVRQQADRPQGRRPRWCSTQSRIADPRSAADLRGVLATKPGDVETGGWTRTTAREIRLSVRRGRGTSCKAACTDRAAAARSAGGAHDLCTSALSNGVGRLSLREGAGVDRSSLTARLRTIGTPPCAVHAIFVESIAPSKRQRSESVRSLADLVVSCLGRDSGGSEERAGGDGSCARSPWSGRCDRRG